MSFQPVKAIQYLALAAAFLLVSCQSNPVIPTATTQATPAGQTPVPEATRAQPAATPGASTTPAASLPDAASLKGMTIQFWHPFTGDLAKQVDAAVADFNQQNTWGIKVQAQPQYSSGALYDAVKAGMQGGTAPSLPQVVAATSDQLAEWSAQSDMLVDLNPYVNQPGTGMSTAEIKSFQPVFWTQDQAGSRRMGIPALRTAQVIYYNQTWAKALGFQTPPKTPDEFKQQACAAAKATTALGDRNLTGTGGWLVDNDALTTLSWLTAFGAKAIPDAEGKPYTFESKEAETAVSYLRGMLDQGCAWTGRNPLPYTYFTQRMALFYTGSMSDLYTQSRYQEQAKNKDQWTVLPFPGSDGKPLVYASGYSYALLKTKDPQSVLAGWLFIHWLEQPKVAVKLAQALPSLPVSSAVTDQLGSQKSQFPWTAVLPLADIARPAPALSTWRTVRRLFEDAAWQIYQLPAEGLDKVLPQTLPQLDAAVQDALKTSP
ncbi:MAG TPA: hypothetical protein VF806_04270 [Anaerolineaceae bacterium]